MRAGRPAVAPLAPSPPELSHSWGSQFSNLPPFASSSPPFIPACCLLLQVENVSFIANKLETIWKGIASGEYTNFSLKTTLFLCSLAEDVGVTPHVVLVIAGLVEACAPEHLDEVADVRHRRRVDVFPRPRRRHHRRRSSRD
uniref:Uncharacterized protein n=1 Tax=Oryza sativa subsp. japonica TaxID=39947 RepID=Q2QQ71_ORYSJ|nr:hypothetical protein LOC_Os12g32020 [Oryza sativa Japonica Group]